jgi:hypothetical protein
MAWFQTVCWLPIRSPLVRAYLTLLGIFLLIATPAWLLVRELVSPQLLYLLGGAELAGLYALACLGLAHDRRGDDWSFGLDRAVDWCRDVVQGAWLQPVAFHSASAAQDWYESHCHDLLLKGVMLLLTCNVALMYLWVPPGKTLAFQIWLASILGMPLVMAGSQGASLGRMRPVWSKNKGPITFMATRPILTGELVDAKYRMVTRNVMQIWLMTLLITAAFVLIKGQAHEVAELLRSFLQRYPGWRGWTILGLSIGLAPVFTWKLMTDSLTAVLTGRKWIADGIVIITAGMLLGSIAAVLWYVTHLHQLSRHLPIMIWTLASLVILKSLGAAWAFSLALDRGLIRRDSIWRLLTYGSVVAVATLALAHLLIPAGSLAVPRLVALVATLSLLPLARFALAPLALEWNRSR